MYFLTRSTTNQTNFKPPMPVPASSDLVSTPSCHVSGISIAVYSAPSPPDQGTKLTADLRIVVINVS